MSRRINRRTGMLRAAALSAILSLSACGGGNNSVEAPPPPPPPKPPIAIGGTVSGLAGGSVSLSLNNSETLVVSSNGSYTFSAQQAPGAAWSVAIARAPLAQNCSLSNGSGTADGTPVSNVTVNCALRTWKSPETFGAPAGQFQQRPLVAIDSQGTAVVVAKELTGLLAYAGRLQVAERSATGTWTPVGSRYLDTSVGDVNHFVFGYDLASAGNGHSFVAWEEVQPDESRHIYASRRTGVGTWTPPTRIDSGAAAPVISAPQVAVSADGTAMAVWVSYYLGADGFAVHASRYQPATGWSTPVRIEDNSESAKSPQVAMDANGNAAVVWVKGSGSTGYIYGAGFRAATGWTAPVLLHGASSTSSDGPVLAMNASGNAVAAWQNYDADTVRGFASAALYSAANGWNTGRFTLTSDADSFVNSVDVAINASGAAFVAMNNVAMPGFAYSTRVVRFTPSAGWDTPFIAATGGTVGGIAIDADGNGTVVFSDTSLLARRYLANGPGAGWQPIDENIDAVAEGRANDARIAHGPNGSALVVYSQVTATEPFMRTPQAVRLD